MTKSQAKRITTLIKRYNKTQAAIKAGYVKGDALFEKLMQLAPVGLHLDGPDGKKYQIKDNFAEKNKCYKASGFSRYELAPVKQ
jgi:hypothetical protein